MSKIFLKNNKIKILGKKTILTFFCKKDINNKYLSWLKNKKNLKYSNNKYKTFNYQKAKKYFLSFDNKINFFFKIYALDNSFIGTLSCYTDKIHGHANIGLLIGDTKYQGKGFGLDAWNSAINYLFKVKKIRKIFAGTMACNLSMKKIFIKSGMKFEARFRDQEILNRKYFDTIYYSIFNKIKK
jgi:RimJ/RimL family protein N-acetyltransferase